MSRKPIPIHQPDPNECSSCTRTRCPLETLTAALMGTKCRYGAHRFPGDEDIPCIENPNWVAAQNAYDEQLAAMRAQFGRRNA